MPSLYENLRTGKGERLFQHPSEGRTLTNFADVFTAVNDISIQTDEHGIISLSMPTFRHNRKDENVVVTAKTLNTGKPDKPKMLILPPYPFSTKLTKALFVDRTFSDWEQEGIAPFESRESMPAPYRSAQGAVYAYAGGIRMLHERIIDAHDKGKKVGVFGFSYGANVTSAYLTYINSLPEDKRAKSLPDLIFVVEGGNILDSTLRSTFGKRADPDTVAAINENPEILPIQEPLSSDVADRTLAIVNHNDLAVLGQEETWDGAKMVEVGGTHVKAPLLKLPTIRKLLRTHFQTLINS